MKGKTIEGRTVELSSCRLTHETADALQGGQLKHSGGYGAVIEQYVRFAMANGFKLNPNVDVREMAMKDKNLEAKK